MKQNQISLGKSVTTIGLIITFSSFVDYFLNNLNSNGLSSLGFIYGIPISLIGSALQYAEIKPIPIMSTYTNNLKFKEKATENMKSIVKDISRFKYGDKVHFLPILKSLNLTIPYKSPPELLYGICDYEDKKSSITLIFQSEEVPFTYWNKTYDTLLYNRFFGPDVDCNIIKIDPNKKLVGLQIKSLIHNL